MDQGDKAQRCQSAAEDGDARSQFLFGVMCQHGRGVPQSDGEALKWFRLAANQGLPEAQFILAVMLQNGRGGECDSAEAARWYRKAADRGHAAAQFALGILYESGQGVQQNPEQATVWFRKAADQGHEEAMSKLGIDTDRSTLMARLVLMRDFPDADGLLHQIIGQCGDTNALVASHRTLARLINVEDTDTVASAVAVLKSQRWVDVRQIGESPTVNAYLLGSRAVWTAGQDTARSATFKASVVIAGDGPPDG